MIIGEIKEINRFPVKSLAGESLNHVQIDSYGLYGDRSHALVDVSKQGWDRFITARAIPQLLGYRAQFGTATAHQSFPEVLITDSNGRVFNWNDEFLNEINLHSNRSKNMALETHKPNSTDLLAVDTASILIITESSIQYLENVWGHALDKRRFRANLIVMLYDDIPFMESEWVHQQLHIGSVALKVDEPCKRCTMITMDPDNYQKDNTLLKLLHEERNSMFGMYASVVSTGVIRVGDTIRLHRE